jgi:D-aminopeptidase
MTANRTVDGRVTDGSVIVVIATDLPLAQAQLQRLARRAQNGLARTGCITAGTSGEVVVAFSTSRERPSRPVRWQRQLDTAFRAVGEAVEEAVLDGLFSATDLIGRGGRRQTAFPSALLPELLRPRVEAEAR